MPFTYHRESLTSGIDLANSTGIEIGPLVNPMVRPDESDVRYVDRATTQELKKWYANESQLNVDDIMPISYVWGDQSLAQATGGEEQFDYCIASHVIEHIPDLISWLNEISSVLKAGGIASFAVPDKRYTFDYLRSETTLADLVDNYLAKRRKPSTKQIYDHFTNFAELDVMHAWSHDFDPSNLTRENSKASILGVCKEALQKDKYIDSHCSVFTAESFFELLEGVCELGLLDFNVRNVFPAKRGMFEFFVQLEKLDSSMSQENKLQSFRKSMQKGTYFDVEMTANSPCVAKIYYDVGNSFCEQDSVESHYQLANRTQTVRFQLPSDGVKAIRFDPSNHELSLEINHMRVCRDGECEEITLSSLQAGDQLAESRLVEGVLKAKTKPDAKDPYFVIPTI